MQNRPASAVNMSSGFKWFMILFILVVVLSTVVSYYGSSLAKTSITRQMSGATEQTATQAIGKLDQLLSVYESIGLQMLRNTELRNTLYKLPDYKENQYLYESVNQTKIQPLLNGYKESVPNIAYVRLIRRDGWKEERKAYFTSIPSTDIRITSNDEILIKRIIEQDGRAFWSNTKKNGYFAGDSDAVKNSGGYSVLMGMLLKDLRDPQKNFVGTVEVQIAAIEALMKNVHFGENSEFMIVNKDRRIIFANDVKTIGQTDPYAIELDGDTGSVVTMENEEQVLHAYAKSMKADWYLITRIPISGLHKDVNQISTYAIISLIMLLLVMGGTLYMFRRFFKLFEALTHYSNELNHKSIALESSNVQLMDQNNQIERQAMDLMDKNELLERQSALMEKKNTELEALHKVKDQILANTSHELRTPINGIIGITESLVDGIAGPMNEIAIKNLSIIINSGQRLISLVNDILDFSKIKNDKLQLNRKAIRLEPIVEMVLLLSRPLIGKKTIRMSSTITGAIPLIWADPHRLQQVFHNLISNAVKFTEKGEITLGAYVKGEMISIWVKDTGIGIKKENFDVIFKSFEQVDGSSQRNYGGTGLGLAVTKQLIELHGGAITVESTVGQGSTFTFTMPMAKENQLRDVVEEEDKLVFSEAAFKAISHFEPIKFDQTGDVNILIVDDEPINLQVLGNHLSKYDFGITSASSGVEALAILKQNAVPFDLVLLDVMMPNLSGYEVCKTIRKTKEHHELPIILLTAKNQLEDVITGFQAGANDYLAKPFAKEELMARMQMQLRLAKLSRLIKMMKDRLKDADDPSA